MHDREQDEDALVERMLHAAAAVQAHVDAALAAVGLSLPKLAALVAVQEAGESLPLSQLAERLSCVKSNITQLVDWLETQGLVRREADPQDRRTRLAVLTPAGRVASREGRRIRAEAERRLLAGFTRDEAHRLHALARRLERRASRHGSTSDGG